MTVQISDPFHWKEQIYILIDIEKGKQMFSAEEIKRLRNDEFWSSACWRGYFAELFMEKGILYGVLHGIHKGKRKGKKKPLSFTGACVIAKRPEDTLFWTADFLSSYLQAEEAYELYFCDGKLTEVRNLGIAIEDYRRKYGEREPDSGTSFWLAEKDMAKRYLKYNYDTRSYKWR